jgi:hypothetical protein
VSHVSVAGCVSVLDKQARELDRLSKDLAGVERELEPIRREVEKHHSDFEIGLWHKHVSGGEKFPPEKLRERLSVAALDPALYGRFAALSASRKRMEQRIRDLKAAVDAQRSILSALKLEAEAARS